MSQYRATIHVWPHSTGRGADKDRKDAGQHEQVITVSADNMRAALSQVELYVAGIETNPMVWQAPIYKIEQVP